MASVGLIARLFGLIEEEAVWDQAFAVGNNTFQADDEVNTGNDLTLAVQ